MSRKVLIADDDADDRYLFEHAFGSRSDLILLPSAVHGQEVIEILDKTADPANFPDLILLDQNMPLMNGKQTLAMLKSTPRYAHIPVGICSTFADDRLIEACTALGAFLVVSKPITTTEYQEMVDQFMNVFKSR